MGGNFIPTSLPNLQFGCFSLACDGNTCKILSTRAEDVACVYARVCGVTSRKSCSQSVPLHLRLIHVRPAGTLRPVDAAQSQKRRERDERRAAPRGVSELATASAGKNHSSSYVHERRRKISATHWGIKWRDGTALFLSRQTLDMMLDFLDGVKTPLTAPPYVHMSTSVSVRTRSSATGGM